MNEVVRGEASESEDEALGLNLNHKVRKHRKVL